MQEFNISSFTPQDKIVGVNNKFGNTGIKNQQGSTVVLYDTLPLDGRNEFRFFEGSSQRNFPFSNTGSDGNKLGVGSSMIIARAYFTIVQFDPIAGTWLQPQNVEGIDDALNIAEFGFELANSTILKQYSGLDFSTLFNKTINHDNQVVLQWDTQLNIPPLLEFVATWRVQQGLNALENAYLRLTIEGTGAIIAPRTTF
jgi:hypothetical protein